MWCHVLFSHYLSFLWSLYQYYFTFTLLQINQCFELIIKKKMSTPLGISFLANRHCISNSAVVTLLQGEEPQVVVRGGPRSWNPGRQRWEETSIAGNNLTGQRRRRRNRWDGVWRAPYEGPRSVEPRPDTWEEIEISLWMTIRTSSWPHFPCSLVTYMLESAAFPVFCMFLCV